MKKTSVSIPTDINAQNLNPACKLACIDIAALYMTSNKKAMIII